MNKKAALGRRNRRGVTIRQYNYANAAHTPEAMEDMVKRRFEREIPLTQAAMIRFTKLMRAKSIKVIWFAAGKTDITRMLKDCKMWAEIIPREIAHANNELGSYFAGAGKLTKIEYLTILCEIKESSMT